jgi:hypothetical protein
MKFTLSFLAVILLVTACRPHKDSADDAMLKVLPGTWLWEAKYAGGSKQENMLTVAPDKSFTLTITVTDRTNGPPTIRMEGTFRIAEGILIETITIDSQTNAAPLPRTNRTRIVRIDERELVLDCDKMPGVAYATNEIVFLKQTK